MVEQIEIEDENDAVAFVHFMKAQEKEIVDKTLGAVYKLKERSNSIEEENELEEGRIQNYYGDTGWTRRLELIWMEMTWNLMWMLVSKPRR